MTACATVADVLALTDNPRSLTLRALCAAFGIGMDRARVVRELAAREAKVRAVMRTTGASDAEAREWLRMHGVDA